MELSSRRAARGLFCCAGNPTLTVMRAIGVDLGGSHVMAAVVEDGAIKSRAENDIVDRTFDVVAKMVAATIREVLGGKKDGLAIGVGSPGNVDLATGVIRYSPNFGWHDAPLGAKLREQLDMPVFVANDARCATLGEHTYGGGRGAANFVLLTLGTGIGGGIVAEGTLLIGNSARAGEIGPHQVRATDGFYCNCGRSAVLKRRRRERVCCVTRSPSRRRFPAANCSPTNRRNSDRRRFAEPPKAAMRTRLRPGTATSTTSRAVWQTSLRSSIPRSSRSAAASRAPAISCCARCGPKSKN